MSGGSVAAAARMRAVSKPTATESRRGSTDGPPKRASPKATSSPKAARGSKASSKKSRSAARDAFAILRSSVTLRGPDTFARSASTAKGTARQNEGCTRKPRDAEKRRARTSLSGSSRSTCMR
jgi:hypothetical protein